MRKIFLLNLFFFLFFSNLYSQNTWKQIGDKHGVKVYSRKQDNSKFDELKAITYAETNVSALVALLIDVENYPDWIYASKKAYLIKFYEDNEFSYYHHSEAPWPASDRDYVARTRISQSTYTKTVYTKSRSVSGLVSEKKDIIRVTDFEASWEFKPVDNGRVKITYKIQIDTGGNVPAWLINHAAEIAPINSLSNMREAVKKSKYKNAKFDFIQNQ